MSKITIDDMSSIIDKVERNDLSFGCFSDVAWLVTARCLTQGEISTGDMATAQAVARIQTMFVDSGKLSDKQFTDLVS